MSRTVGLRAMWRVDPGSAYTSAPSVLVAGLAFAVAGGIAELPGLWHSQLPTTSPSSLAPVIGVVSLGVGARLVAAVAARPRAPKSSEQPPTTSPREASVP